nr:MAG TPA: hypothetical protein [Caudoviricetes sp.]
MIHLFQKIVLSFVSVKEVKRLGDCLLSVFGLL